MLEQNHAARDVCKSMAGVLYNVLSPWLILFSKPWYMLQRLVFCHQAVISI